MVNQEGQGGGSGSSSVVSGTGGASLDSNDDGNHTKEEEVDENSEAYKLKQAKAEEERMAEETALATARAAAEANKPVTPMGTGTMCVTIASDVIEEIKRLAYVREEGALVFQADQEDKGSLIERTSLSYFVPLDRTFLNPDSKHLNLPNPNLVAVLPLAHSYPHQSSPPSLTSFLHPYLHPHQSSPPSLNSLTLFHLHPFPSPFTLSSSPLPSPPSLTPIQWTTPSSRPRLRVKRAGA